MIKIIILGIIQGIGEFLPISSSAHLILIPYLFNIPQSSLAFDVALHFGTLLSILTIYFSDWYNLLKGAYLKIKKNTNSFENKMFWYLTIATIPGAILGFLLNNIIDNIFRKNIPLIAVSLLVMGIFIYIGDKWASKHYKIETEFENINIFQSFLIGLSQSLAIIPGFSRSGTTILTSRLLGLSKEASTKFTFLLSVPIILGATLLELPHLELSLPILLGLITSFLVGLFTIKFLLNYVKKHDFSIFSIYRIILSIIVLTKYFLN